MFSCEREDQVVWAVAVLQYGTQAQNCSLSPSLSLSLSQHIDSNVYRKIILRAKQTSYIYLQYFPTHSSICNRRSTAEQHDNG